MTPAYAAGFGAADVSVLLEMGAICAEIVGSGQEVVCALMAWSRLASTASFGRRFRNNAGKETVNRFSIHLRATTPPVLLNLLDKAIKYIEPRGSTSSTVASAAAAKTNDRSATRFGLGGVNREMDRGSARREDRSAERAGELYDNRRC